MIALTLNELARNRRRTKKFKHRKYHPEDDTVNSVLYDICKYLDYIGVGVFRVTGLGIDDWPFALDWDMIFLLEDMPRLVKWLKSERIDALSLGFYEQGTEIILNLESSGSDITITSRRYEYLGGTIFATTKTNVDEISKEVNDLLDQFIALVNKYCPDGVSTSLRCKHKIMYPN